MPNDLSPDLFWAGGCNSVLHPVALKEGEYQWGVNIDNTGGILSPRNGFHNFLDTSSLYDLEPRGGKLFTTGDGIVQLVLAIGPSLYYTPYPFTATPTLIKASAFATDGPVVMEKCVRSAETKKDGTTALLDAPYPLLVIGDGQSRMVSWDGAKATTLDPSADGGYQTPVGLWMRWIGGRLWISNGTHIKASNLEDPLTFTENKDEGDLVLPDICTGMVVTHDFKNLLAFTDTTTTSFQSSISDRTQWAKTNEFQHILLPGIGCAAGKSPINQFGLTWWYSHDGLIGLDMALRTYLTSKIHYRDSEMNRSKSNLSDDISGITTAAYGNRLLVSVPSGDGHNVHTWSLNQVVVDTLSTSGIYSPPTGAWSGIWTGIQPVEWITGVVHGVNRCFALSRDIPLNAATEGHTIYPNMWEAFIGEKSDLSFNNNIQKIPCVIETRILGASQKLRKFEYAEFDACEIEGLVNVQMYYAGLRGGYKLILSKQIAATAGGANGPDQATGIATMTSNLLIGQSALIVDDTSSFKASGNVYAGGRKIAYASKSGTQFNLTTPSAIDIVTGSQVTQRLFKYPSSSTILQSYRPQHRTVTSQMAEISLDDCSACAIESPRNDNLDRGFSLLIKWTGKMNIYAIRLFTSDPNAEEQRGKCEEDELTSRYITDEGCGQIVDTIIQPDSYTFGKNKSRYLQVTTPKFNEEPYRAFIP